MTLHLTSHRVEDVLVTDMRGKLTIYEDAFRDFVRHSVQAGERRIVLKLTDLSYLDSAGLGQLVSAYLKFKETGTELRLLSPSPRARYLLKMTKLDTVFTILEDETSILGAPKSSPLPEADLSPA